MEICMGDLVELASQFCIVYTLVFLAQDSSKDGWRSSGGGPGMFACQGGRYSLHQTRSDLSEQMHAFGGFYLPSDMIPYGSHIITEKHFSLATSVIESEPSRYNNIKHPTPPTWYYSAASSERNHQSREIHWDVEGFTSRSARCAWTVMEARNFEIPGQVLCRYSSSCYVSEKSLEGVFPERHELPVRRTTPIARASSLPHSVLRPKTRKNSINRANTGHEEKSSPVTRKCNSSKASDAAVKGVYVENKVHSMPFERMHSRLANKAPQSAEKVDRNMPRTASPEPHQIFSVKANCTQKDGKKWLASNNDAPLENIKGGQEGECSSINGSVGKATMTMCHSSPNFEKDFYEDHHGASMPFDPVVPSSLITPLAIKECSEEGFQSAHFPAMNERWAGPGFSNSPPPSSLPVPTFTRRQSRTSSLAIAQAQAVSLTESICVSAPGTPSFSSPNVGAFSSHYGTNYATQSLRRLLNLD